ncbi:MAG: HD domain-containing protein [bacterium]
MESIVDKAKAKMLKMINDHGSDPYRLLVHVPEMEKWAKAMLSKYPEADADVILLSVWLHDIGHYPIPAEIDHAIRSEKIAKEFLSQENYDADKLEKVLHCVRAHRCSDVLPESLEAKIVAFIDSASHMTDVVYFKMAKDSKEGRGNFSVFGKMERDMRDLAAFPEIQAKITGLFNAWKNLIEEYKKFDLE